MVRNLLIRGAFNNYVDKNRWMGVNRKSTVGHVIKDRYFKTPEYVDVGQKINVEPGKFGKNKIVGT